MNIINELYTRIDNENLWDKDISLDRNDFLSVPGNIETHFYYITSGSLKVYIVDGDEELIIRFGYRNEFITALDSFISEKSTDFYIQALKKTTLKAITRTKYNDFIQKNEANRSLWYTIMEQFVLQQLEREKDILISSPLERYRRVLKRSPHLFQEIPHKYIASYLRMSPETLSRIKKS
ncbi:MAG: Crp/Fnr family transcriptional regulator [Bacteroidota bacterium]